MLTLNANSNTINYKEEFLKFTKEEIIDMIQITPSMAEQFEVKIAGAKRFPGVNGADGIFDDGKMLEVKTQIYSGNYEFRGRGKYSAVSPELYDKKLKDNEHTVIVGIDEKSGDVFYRFSFEFAALKDEYNRVVKDTYGKKSWNNYDCYPQHYVWHDSFKIEHVASVETLYENRDKFTKKFLLFLLNYKVYGVIDKGYDPKDRSHVDFYIERAMRAHRNKNK